MIVKRPRRFHWSVKKKVPYGFPPKAAEKKSKDDQVFLTKIVTVVTWNVEGKGDPAEIDFTLSKEGRFPDIVCLQEAKFPAGVEETKNFKWLCSGPSGSAILINKKQTLEAISFEQSCQQLCVAEIGLGNDIKVNVISCYIPPSTDYRSEELWTKLAEILKTIHTSVMFVLAGDFNAQIGRKDLTKEDLSFFGNALYHDVCNENGIKLKNLMKMAHLKAASTFVQEDKNSSWHTYRDNNEKSQRDFVIIPILRKGSSQDNFNYWHKDHNHAMHGSKITVSKRERIGTASDNDLSSKMVISTWNIQGATPSKVDSVLNEQGLPIICIQELFLTSDEDLKTDNYTWFSSKKQWAKNVGILIKTSPDISLTNFQSISECLCSGDVVFHGEPVKILCCHIPAPSDSRYETVTKELIEMVKSIPKETFFLVTGDFTAVIEENNLSKDETKNESESKNFLTKLEEECKLYLRHIFWKNQPNLSNSNVETERKSLHQILMPLSYKNNTILRTFLRWIPFFNNSILNFYVKEQTLSNAVYLKDEVKSHNVLPSEKEYILENPNKTVVINGVDHKYLALEYYLCTSDDEEDLSPESTNLLSSEDREKLKDTPISLADLDRILKDFVVFQGPNKKSNFSMFSPLVVLVNSFKTGGFGKLIVEDFDPVNNTSPTTHGITTIRWNGILLEKYTGPEAITKRKKIIAHNLLSRLSMIFPTVKGKRSFYHKGLKPLLMGDPQLDGDVKVMKKSSLPAITDVKKCIEDFFEKDTDCELVFGPDFTEQDLKNIRVCAKELKLGYRFFASSFEQECFDHIAVFKKRSPQYLRDLLVQHSKNSKYYLIPPCGKGANYVEFNAKFEGQYLKDEHRMFQKYWVDNAKLKTKGTKVEEGKTAEEKSEQQSQDKNDKTDLTKQPTSGQNELKANLPSRPARRRRRYGLNRKRNLSSSETGIRKRRFSPQRPGLNEQERNFSSPHAGTLPEKRQRMDDKFLDFPKLSMPRWNDLAPLIIVWPLTIRSTYEERSRKVLEANFPVEFPQGPKNTVAAVVRLPLRYLSPKKYCLCISSDIHRAADMALRMILKHSTVIKLNPTYLCNGEVPNFVRYKVPCQTNPRTYIILSYYETGPLTIEKVEDILETFKASYNEDVFFDRDGYTFQEKMLIIDHAPSFNLKVRHFGETQGVADRYVCVYKVKPKEEILQEVLKMGSFHPKYLITTNRLPPRLGLNVF